MSISYKYEGYDLTEWADFGGLPIWVSNRFPKRIFAICDDFAMCPKDPEGGNILAPTPVHLEFVSIRYIDPHEVIYDAPKWANWFAVGLSKDSKGKGFFFENEPDMIDEYHSDIYEDDGAFFYHGKFAPVKNHLFDPTDYPTPLELKHE